MMGLVWLCIGHTAQNVEWQINTSEKATITRGNTMFLRTFRLDLTLLDRNLTGIYTMKLNLVGNGSICFMKVVNVQ